jgi:spermidine/putrescine-binding protein
VPRPAAFHGLPSQEAAPLSAEGVGVTKRLVPVVVAGALGLSACGASESGPSTLGPPACVEGQTDGDLALYNWPNYLPTGTDARAVGIEDLLAAFEAEYGVQVSVDTYDSNEELRASLAVGGKVYDLAVPSDYMVSVLIAEGALRPLQMEAIPNRANVDPEFLNPPFDPEGRFQIPYLWGTTGIGLATAGLPTGLPESWDLIFDSEVSSIFGGKVSLLDDARETLGAALRYLGHSFNSTDETEIREAGDLVAELVQRGDVEFFDSEGFVGRLASGDVLAAHGYSSDFFREIAVLTASGRRVPQGFSYVVPEEGAVIWVDAMVVPANAAHPCTAHTFINFLLDPLHGAALADFNWCATPNAVAKYLMDAEILNDPAIYPPQEVADRLEFLVNLGTEVEALYEEVFAEARG